MQQNTTEKERTLVQSAGRVGGESAKEQNNLQTILAEDYELNLSDFALFMSVMKVKEAYEDVLSIILDEENLKLKEVKVEQVVLNKSGNVHIQ